jgi:DNA-binding PadR family transcriptional regulator
MKKGYLRLFILANLHRGPIHGYGIIKRISERSDGFWSPKAGNIYPLIQDMVSEGLIEQVGPATRRKLYGLTDKGKVELLRLFGEAENAIVHLIQAMNRDDGEWVQTHIQLLHELSPADRDERIRSLFITMDSLIEVLGKTREKFKERLPPGSPDS